MRPRKKWLMEQLDVERGLRAVMQTELEAARGTVHSLATRVERLQGQLLAHGIDPGR